MPSHKQKRDRKRSRKHKHRVRSRSPARRKNEGKKENIPVNPSNWDTELRDLNCLVENKREMIRQIFAAVGEEFLKKHTPTILKKKTIEDLKKICLEELSLMSSDMVFKILEGIPCDAGSSTSPGDHPQQTDKSCSSSKTYCGHTSLGSPDRKLSVLDEECEEPDLVSSKADDEEISSEERKSEGGESSAEGKQSDSEEDDSQHSEGIQCDRESSISPERRPVRKSKSPKTCCRHTSSGSSKRKRCVFDEKREKSEQGSSKEVDEDLSSEGSKTEAGESSAEGRQSDTEEDDSQSSENESSGGKCEVASTSNQPSMTKKLAKVAPFHISFPKRDVCEAVASNEDVLNGSDLEYETSSEMAELEMEEGVENEGDSVIEESVVEVPPDVSALNENLETEGVIVQEEQQNMSEVVELEHRARAIRSMLANIDVFQP